ncbi:hypothetical protein FG05_35151 [Fusarium graminearum]|nr:hypothetical protein FG05_35151 [Fusarium graminearum]
MVNRDRPDYGRPDLKSWPRQVRPSARFGFCRIPPSIGMIISLDDSPGCQRKFGFFRFLTQYCVAQQGTPIKYPVSVEFELLQKTSFSTAKPDSEVSCRHEISDHCFLAWYMKTDIVKK